MSLRALITAVLLAGCAACTSGTPALPPVRTPSSFGPPPTASTTTPVRTADSGSSGAAKPGPTKVLTVVEENHGQSSALQGMPYLASLARTYGRTSMYRTVSHPSLPNYLAMAGGSTFGVSDDASPAWHQVAGPSVFDVARSRGKTAKTYVEGMSLSCQTSGAGRYAVKHNPWAYFASASSRSACGQFDVPAGTPAAGPLRSDVAHGDLPAVGLVIPDLCHDAHDCSLAVADAWLKGWLPLVLSGPDYRAGRLAVVVTFDEVEGGGTGSILTAVIHPSLHHKVVASSLSHLSWCRWMTDLVGASPLRRAGSAASLGRAFALS